jgi:hypothetical protein
VIPHEDVAPKIVEEPAVDRSVADRSAEVSAKRGIYETIRVTAARREPNDQGEVVDELGRSRRLNVIGSIGEWLVVRSKTRQLTVYVNRNDAVLLPEDVLTATSSEFSEDQRIKVETDIVESLAKWNVRGVTVSFRQNTAYLEGEVTTEYERYRAGLAAHSIPEVQHIENRVRLVR